MQLTAAFDSQFLRLECYDCALPEMLHELVLLLDHNVFV